MFTDRLHWTYKAGLDSEVWLLITRRENPKILNQINQNLMVEVFKTNVIHTYQANMLIDQIQKAFTNYVVNFDLQDCDRILRVCSAGLIISSSLIALVNELGFHAEVLSDEPVSLSSINFTNGLYSHTNQLN